MELSKFLLYYAILLQAIFCIYIFNPKMEWALMVGSFYLIILFTYGLTSELYKTTDQLNPFVEIFKVDKSNNRLDQIGNRTKYKRLHYIFDSDSRDFKYSDNQTGNKLRR